MGVTLGKHLFLPESTSSKRGLGLCFYSGQALEDASYLTDVDPLLAHLRGWGGGESHVLSFFQERLRHASPRTDHQSGSYFQMPRHASLSRDNGVVSDAGAASDTDLGDNNTVPANGRIVSDLHLIVDLGSFPDPGFSKTGPVYRAVSAYFHIIVDLHGAHLIDFLMPAIDKFVTKSIRTDHDTCVQGDPVAEYSAVV